MSSAKQTVHWGVVLLYSSSFSICIAVWNENHGIDFWRCDLFVFWEMYKNSGNLPNLLCVTLPCIQVHSGKIVIILGVHNCALWARGRLNIQSYQKILNNLQGTFPSSESLHFYPLYETDVKIALSSVDCYTYLGCRNSFLFEARLWNYLQNVAVNQKQQLNVTYPSLLLPPAPLSNSEQETTLGRGSAHWLSGEAL